MDSTWFAVDDDGHVGFFASGEDGAVPTAARQPDSGDDAVEAILRGGVEFLIARGALVLGRHMDGEAHRRSGGLFLLAEPESAMGTYLEIGPAVQIGSERLLPAHSCYVADEAFDRLHASGVCRGCLGDSGGELARAGVFPFECENYGTSPYARVATPAAPVRLDELPESVRRSIEAVTLPGVRFASAASVQPLEHVDSYTWRAEEFIGTDGETYPVGANASIALGTGPARELNDVAGRRSPLTAAIVPWHPPPRPRPRWWQFWK